MDCTILAQQNVLEVFENRTAVFKGQPSDNGAEWENYPEISGTRWSLPSLTFSERMVLHWGDPEIVIEHRPGPTSGSVWVVIPAEKIVFVGDTITKNQPPFFASGNLPSWIKIISDLRSPKFRNYQIISGRGGPVDIEYIRHQHEMLKNLLKKLGGLAEKGSVPQETESLIDPFLKQLDYPSSYQQNYEQRLRYGLYHYFQRHFLPDITNGD
jgi:glyoxylase-like metal-dependent hydrolase (beta-lactamase superfamily II)